MNQAIHTAIETAKAKVAGQPAWERSVAKAAQALLNGQLIVTVLADNGGVVTSENGSYTIRHGFCSCPAAQNGRNHCYRISALRICALADELATAPAPTKKAPYIVRCVERDVVTKRRVRAVYCDGWSI